MAPCTALVTDSTSNLTPDLATSRHIYVAPLYVIWGEEMLRDGVDMTDTEFYRRLVAADEIPTTSQVAPQDFTALFEKVRRAEQADEIVCGVISSELSGTYASAIQARNQVDFPVHVIDTRQASWALGHAILAGADARDEGASPAEIAEAVVQAAQHQKLLFTVKSLEHLHRGGRIGNARKLLGSALSIQPVLELNDGVIEAAENVRTRKRAIEYLLKLAEEHANGQPIGRFSVLHGDALDEAEALLARVIELFNPRETYLSYLTPTLGVHVGPGALGVAVESTVPHSY